MALIARIDSLVDTRKTQYREHADLMVIRGNFMFSIGIEVALHLAFGYIVDLRHVLVGLSTGI